MLEVECHRALMPLQDVLEHEFVLIVTSLRTCRRSWSDDMLFEAERDTACSNAGRIDILLSH